MSLPKLDQPSLVTDRVFDAIRAAIMNGELPAGSRLRVRDLAAQVGTSVMPVREAIRRLEESGLAEREPHKGAVVKGLTRTELIDVYDVRRLLEVQATRLGTERVTARDVERMQREYDRMREAVDKVDAARVLDHDEAMLRVLYDAAGNPVLVDTIRALWERCRTYKIVGARATLASTDASPLWTFQERLLAAARDNDSTGAARIAEESIIDATDRIRAGLADG